jgi:hypothetical protein
MGVTIDEVWIGEWVYWPLGTINNYSAIANLQRLQISITPSKLFSSLPCLHQSSPGSFFQQCIFFSFTPSGSIFTASQAEPNSQQINWIPGWRPFHTNFLVFSSQVDFHLTTNWVAPIVFLIIILHGPSIKHRFQQ